VLGGGMQVVDAVAALPLATDDDMAWLASAQGGLRMPLRQPPAYGLAGFGCWDGTQQAGLLDATQLPSLVALVDPVLSLPPPSFFPYIVSAACGTPLANASAFVANPGTPACPDADRLAVAIRGPASKTFTTSPPSFFSLTCAQFRESMTQRALWRAAFKADFHQLPVFVQTTALHVVPEPRAALAQAVALACLGLLARRPRRRG